MTALIGDAGADPSLARVRSCGEDTDVESIGSVGRGFLRGRVVAMVSSDASASSIKASRLLFLVGRLAMTKLCPRSVMTCA